MGRQPRQRPISCHLCRVRKLRCSRQFPCSNCTSRGLPCQHDDVAVAPTPATTAAAAAAAAAANGGQGAAQAASPQDVTVPNLLARLERLESLLVSQVQHQQPSLGGQPVLAAEPMSVGAIPVGLASRSVPPKLQRLMTDALRLERSYLDQKLTDSTLADPIIFRICPARAVCSQPSFIIQNRGSFPNHEVDAIKCIYLPMRNEMRAIAQKYLTDISLFYHVIHVPTFNNLLEDVYSKLESNSPVEVGRVLLLLSMCASATYAWSARDDENVFSSIAEANAQSIFWVKQGMDISDHAQRISHASMEAVQGLIILFFVICNFESASQRARNVIMLAISAATELQLYRIDGASPVPTSPLARMGEVQKEIGRRVWWYLVTMDWLLSQFSPLQEGFFLLHAGQMAVNWPKNVRDEDLVEGREIIERPMSEPTCVSYLIQRIRLAELTQWMAMRHSANVKVSKPYSSTDILETDAKLKEFIGGIPDFLALDSSSLSHLPPTDPRRSPLVAAQRYALNLILHRQLCKMHLPYLAQGTVDPAYAYSRDVCLRSARVVIGLDHKFLEEHLEFCISKLRLSMVLRSVFLASIALALNACVRGDATDGVDALDDAGGPWQMLMGAYGQTPSGNGLLELSIQLLRKYKIKHDALVTLQRQIQEATALASGSQPMGPEQTHLEQTSLGSATPGLTCASDAGSAMMDQGWQRYEGKPQLDMGLNAVDWDKLFWGSDAPFI